MREDFKALVARYAHERDTGFLGHADGERGGCGDGNDDGCSHPDGFLDEFDGDPACEDHNPGGSVCGDAGQGTCEFVERVVTSDILTQSDEATVECPSGFIEE
jgi:hypothetical protein